MISQRRVTLAPAGEARAHRRGTTGPPPACISPDCDAPAGITQPLLHTHAHTLSLVQPPNMQGRWGLSPTMSIHSPEQTFDAPPTDADLRSIQKTLWDVVPEEVAELTSASRPCACPAPALLKVYLRLRPLTATERGSQQDDASCLQVRTMAIAPNVHPLRVLGVLASRCVLLSPRANVASRSCVREPPLSFSGT